MSNELPDPPAASGSAPLAPGESREREILAHCWEIISDVLLSKGADIFQETIASAARSGDESDLRCARTLSLHGKSLAQAYRVDLRSAFDEGVTALFQSVRTAPAPRKLGLQLVDIDVSNLGSQWEQVAARLRSIVQVSFTEFGLRMQTLGGGRELPETDVPLRPLAVLEAVGKSLSAYSLSSSDLAGLGRHFAPAFAPVLIATYEALNRYLENNGVAPSATRVTPVLRQSIPGTIRMNVPPALLAMQEAHGAPAGAGTQPPASGRPSAASRSTAASAAGAPAEFDENLMREYVRLQALVGVNASVLSEAAHTAASAAAQGQPFAAAAPAATLLKAMMVGQRQDAARLAQPAAPAGEAGGDRAGEAPATEATELDTREYSRRLIALAAIPLHKLSIQLMTRLFTRLERDRLFPGPVRELIVALRFPAIELALADPSVFLRSDHPLRALVDAIGTSAIGVAADGAGGRKHLQQVRSVVHLVVHSPGSAASAFVQAQAQFAAFAAAAAPAGEDPLDAARAALGQAEEAEFRAGDVGTFLQPVLEGAIMEDWLREFVLRVWARVLVEAASQEARDPGVVRRLANVVPDLVASVQPIPAAADRRRMVETIPAVLDRLRDGLGLIGWPSEKIQGLLNRLMIAHSHLLTVGDAAPAVALHAPFSVSTVRIRLDGFQMQSIPRGERGRPSPVLEESLAHALEAGGSGISHLWPRSEIEPHPKAFDAAEAERRMDRWKEGTWFDLRVGRSVARVRLSGFTPSRSVALFAPGGGAPTHSISRESLVAFLRAGYLVPVESLPATARAFRTVLKDLERTARAAADGDGGGA